MSRRGLTPQRRRLDRHRRDTVRSARRMGRNVRLYYAFIFLNGLEMWLPITTLLVIGRGFSLTQYTVLDAVWYVSTVVFEVPTGAVTDRYGKKISLAIAVLAQSLSLFTLAFASSFLVMIVSYVVWGFGSSFETGTSDALIFDSLKQMGREEDYRRTRGRITTLAIFAGALGSVAAGYLGGIDLALPILLTASIFLLTLPLVLCLTEPQVSDAREPSYLLHIKGSVRYVSGHRPVALLMLYTAIMGTAIWGLHDFYQPLLSSFQVPVEKIGLLYLLFRLCGVAGAHFSDSFYRVLSRLSIYLIPVCFILSILGMGLVLSPWVIGFIFVIYFIEGLHYPIVNTLLNRNLPPGKRATIMSLGSVVGCLMNSGVNPTLGRIADVSSLQASFRALGIGVLVCMSPILVFLQGTKVDSVARTNQA